MRTRIIAALALAGSALAGCVPYPGPTATCFTFVESEAPCEFWPVAGAGGGTDGGA